MNKIQIKAEILTLIMKLQTTTAVSDEMFATLDNEPDKQAGEIRQNGHFPSPAESHPPRADHSGTSP